jgi:hypothetical protein
LFGTRNKSVCYTVSSAVPFECSGDLDRFHRTRTPRTNRAGLCARLLVFEIIIYLPYTRKTVWVAHGIPAFRYTARNKSYDILSLFISCKIMFSWPLWNHSTDCRSRWYRHNVLWFFPFRQSAGSFFAGSVLPISGFKNTQFLKHYLGDLAYPLPLQIFQNIKL